MRIHTHARTRKCRMRWTISRRVSSHTYTRLFVSLASFHNFDFINNIFYFFFFPFSYYSVSIPLLHCLFSFLLFIFYSSLVATAVVSSSSSNSHRFLVTNIKHKLGWKHECVYVCVLQSVHIHRCCCHSSSFSSTSSIQSPKPKPNTTEERRRRSTRGREREKKSLTYSYYNIFTKPNGHRKVWDEKRNIYTASTQIRYDIAQRKTNEFLSEIREMI